MCDRGEDHKELVSAHRESSDAVMTLVSILDGWVRCGSTVHDPTDSGYHMVDTPWGRLTFNVESRSFDEVPYGRWTPRERQLPRG